MGGATTAGAVFGAAIAVNPSLAWLAEAATSTSPFATSKILGVRKISRAEVNSDPHVKEIMRNSLDIPPYRSNESNEMILSPRQAWSTKLWWPIFTKRGIERGIPKIHDQWWSAHLYDRMGGSGDVWQQAQEKAEDIKSKHPEAENYAGYCPWVAIEQLTEARPEAHEGEDLAGQTDLREITWLKEGLLAIKHAGDILVPVPRTREVFMALMQMGLPTIVDLPAELGLGNWFRSVQGISADGRWIRATNFGNEDKDFLLSAAVSAWVAYPADSPDDFAPGIREATSFWRYEVDRNFIDQLV